MKRWRRDRRPTIVHSCTHDHDGHDCDYTITFKSSCVCGLAMEAADRFPALGHGWLQCTLCGSIAAACPLGIAERAFLLERAAKG